MRALCILLVAHAASADVSVPAAKVVRAALLATDGTDDGALALEVFEGPRATLCEEPSKCDEKVGVLAGQAPPAFAAVQFFRDDSEARRCGMALHTAAGWFTRPLATCGWMVIASTPRPVVSIERVGGSGAQMEIYFRSGAQIPGERNSAGERNFTLTTSDFLVICRLTPRGIPGCSDPVALSSSNIFQSHGRDRIDMTWKRAVTVGANAIRLGPVTSRGRPLEVVDPHGMYGATKEIPAAAVRILKRAHSLRIEPPEDP